MDGKSLDIRAEKLQQLQQLFPEIFAESKIDLERLQLWLGKEHFVEGQHYELSWAGKQDIVKTLQTPTTATLAPLPNQSLNFDKAKHVFIEGENLLVLKVLQKAYFGRVKMIYIDPPYNTGNDSFAYHDNFKESRAAYNQRTGLKDPQGQLLTQSIWKKNTKENGHFHSVWLSMMYPRLFLARNLLQEDGVIFISIDDNEADNLRLLANEIFGEENFIGKFIWINRTTPNDAALGFATDHEYILAFAKDKTKANFKGVAKDLSKYKNPDNDPNGEWIPDNPTAASGNESYKFPIHNPYTGEAYRPPEGRFWAFAPKRVQEWHESGKLVFPKEKGKNFLLKKYKKELKSLKKPMSSVIQGILTSAGTKELKALFKGASPFKYPKPSALIKQLVMQVTEDSDLVLDFFAGSATTAQAVVEANLEDGMDRRFVCVQMPEKYDSADESLNRKYQFISEVSIQRINKVLHKHGLADENGCKTFCLAPSSVQAWRGSFDNEHLVWEELQKDIERGATSDPALLVYELMLQLGIPLHEPAKYMEEDGLGFWLLGQKAVFIAKKATQRLIDHVLANQQPDTIICLDAAFGGNDSLKLNLAAQLKLKNVVFHVI